MVYRHLGVERVLLANEIYDRDARSSGWPRQDFADLLVYADSPRGVEMLAGKGFRILVELGASRWAEPAAGPSKRRKRSKPSSTPPTASSSPECPGYGAPSPTATASPAI